MKTYHAFIFQVLCTLFLIILFSSCSNSSGPTPSAVIIPGAGSTFTFLNTTRDTNGVIVSQDTTFLGVLDKVNHAGFTGVIMMLRKYSWHGSVIPADTIYIRELSNGDLSEDFPSVDGTSAWFDLPFGSKSLRSQVLDSVFVPSQKTFTEHDTLFQTAVYVGNSTISVKGIPMVANTVTVATITSNVSSGLSWEYLDDTTQYYSIPSIGIPIAGSKVLSSIDVSRDWDVISNTSEPPFTTTLIDYKILP